MSDLPAPLTPPDCDLRDFPFMPLEIRRLLTSETWVLGTAAEKVAALTLWCESWHQVPAASVPSDDRMLAHLSGAGGGWRKVRAMAMRGWIECSDGRLYHPVVAEKALESWEKKHAQRERTKKATEARQRYRHDDAEPTVTDNVTVATHKRNANATEHVTTTVTDNVTSTKGQGESFKKEYVERVFDALWRTWPDQARKRHTQAEVRDAIRGQLKAGADPDAIIAAGKAHVAERAMDDPKLVKGLAPWLKRGLWRNWAPNGNGADAPVDWPLRMRVFRESGGETWPDRWGPKPGEPGFQGPPADDLFAPEPPQ